MSGRPGGPFHVQIVKGKRLSNDLPNRLNDYKRQFPRRRIIAVNVLPDIRPWDGLTTEPKVLYEIVWEETPK